MVILDTIFRLNLLLCLNPANLPLLCLPTLWAILHSCSQNEQKAVALIKHYNVALNKTVKIHGEKVLNYYGDGSLCIFSIATAAMNCAIGVQKELLSDPIVPLRIGLHVGEVFFEDGKAIGDGVNIASRVQSLGQANTILFSRELQVLCLSA